MWPSRKQHRDPIPIPTRPLKLVSQILRKFPNLPPNPRVVRGEGIYLHTVDGRKIMDATAGTTACAVLGYTHPEVQAAMKAQIDRICHIDYNTWSNDMLEELAALLLSRAPEGLNAVYFAGNSGTEAMEAAMKLSYQVHWDAGRKERSWFISRKQSFHGATLQAIGVSELPILEFYEQILPPRIAKIAQHHPLYFKRDDETLDDYARRSAQELEDAIVAIGPERVSAFVGETMLGSLVGDVPPAPGYWQYVRAVCDRYDVHLILDEIYCGLGRSGKSYCCEHDRVVPDFVCVGKTLGAGFAPMSAVITNDRFEKIIATGQGRIQHGHTHQGHALGTAAALAVQRIVQTDAMLDRIATTGDHMRDVLHAELGRHPFFRDLRGRGLLLSLEYDCPDKPRFGSTLARIMNDQYDILVNAKWHRVSLTPPYVITDNEVDRLLDRLIRTFKAVAANWLKEKVSAR